MITYLNDFVNADKNNNTTIHNTCLALNIHLREIDGIGIETNQ